MQYNHCPYCRCYTPPTASGERCSVCGMIYPYFDPLRDALSEVRIESVSAYDPIRVRTERGKTLKFTDGRSSQPYYAKLSYGGEGEYMIMDENSLMAILGSPFIPGDDRVVRRDGKKAGKKVSVSYTRRDDLIPNLNRRSRRRR